MTWRNRGTKALSRKVREPLEWFFGVYLTEDWDVDLSYSGDEPDLADVVAHVVATEPASELRRVVAALETLIDGPLSDDELHEFLYEDVGVAYGPDGDGIGSREWLSRLRDRLRDRHS